MMMMRACLALLVVLGSISSPTQGTPIRRNGTEPYTPHPDSLFWTSTIQYEGFPLFHNMWVRMEANENRGVLTVAVAANTLNWVAFGPSHTGSMIGANFCVLLMNESGIPELKQYHSDDMVFPTLSSINSCHLLSYSFDFGETFFLFERPLIGCVDDADVSIPKAFNSRWIGAIGQSPYFSYHGEPNKGMTDFNPYYGPMPTYDLPEDYQTLDLLFLRHVIPSSPPDTYQCRSQIPPLDRRYHVVSMEAFNMADSVEEAGIEYHHLFVYTCPNGLPPQWEDPSRQRSCSGIGSFPGCTAAVAFSWARGQRQIFLYPAGYPFGAGGYPAATNYIIEGHMYNPLGISGVVEPGWGLRLYYTPTLLDFEGMVMTVYAGIDPRGIPAGQERFELMMECSQECLFNGTQQGFTIQAAAPHMHILGRESTLRVVRNGKETDRLTEIRGYDYNIQGFYYVHPSYPGKHVAAGDRLITTFSWDSTSRSNTTYFGETFGSEMSFTWIYVYPPLTTQVAYIDMIGLNKDLDSPYPSQQPGNCIVGGTFTPIVVDVLPYEELSYPSECPQTVISDGSL